MSIKTILARYLYGPELDALEKKCESYKEQLTKEYKEKSEALKNKEDDFRREYANLERQLREDHQQKKNKLENDRRDFEVFKRQQDCLLKHNIESAQKQIREDYSKYKDALIKDLNKSLFEDRGSVAQDILDQLLHLRPELSAVETEIRELLRKKIEMVLAGNGRSINPSGEFDDLFSADSWARSIPDFKEEPNQ